MRVLLADADERFLELAQAYLWECGHEAEIVENSLECSILLREFAPDVLVLDHDILWEGSKDVLSRMQEDSRLSFIPVIVMADKGLPESADGVPDPLMVEWLRRPFLLPELLTCIDSTRRLRTLQAAGEMMFDDDSLVSL